MSRLRAGTKASAEASLYCTTDNARRTPTRCARPSAADRDGVSPDTGGRVAHLRSSRPSTQRENASVPLRARLVTTKSESRRLRGGASQVANQAGDKSAGSTGSADFVVACAMLPPSCAKLERTSQMLTLPPGDFRNHTRSGLARSGSDSTASRDSLLSGASALTGTFSMDSVVSEFGEDRLSRLLDDPGFGTIHSEMARFNLFEAVGAVRSELRHSNFLAYLLSPSRSHGLGSAVLEAVLRAILEMLPPHDRPVMTLELIVADINKAYVYRERDNIDLLIEIDTLKLVVVIENKVDAKAGDGQLNRYWEATEARYPKHRKLYVYLTPLGDESGHPRYVSFSYVRLTEILDKLGTTASIALETAIIVRHYVEMLRRHIVPDERLRELAAKLYERHTEALDFIFECRPQQGGVLEALYDRIEQVGGLLIDSRGANVVRFAPDAWESLKSIRCDTSNWTHTGRALLFELKTFVNAPGRVNLALVLGPASPEARLKFYEAARSDPEMFQGLVKPMGQKWASIFSHDLQTSVQAKGLTIEQQANNATLAWSDFQGFRLQGLIRGILDIDMGHSANA